MRKAHQISFELTNGSIPAGQCVCHTCDVPACVNPDHLWLGTPGDNSRDCERKGRRPHRGLRGTASPTAKLTDADVHEIRRLAGTLPQGEIGRRFGVSQTAVSKIVRRVRWTHV